MVVLQRQQSLVLSSSNAPESRAYVAAYCSISEANEPAASEREMLIFYRT